MPESPQSRRIHLRLKCKGIARVRRLPSGDFLDGVLADLSVRGCCIEIQSPLVLEMGSLVEVLLNVKGTALRLNGTIRHNSRRRRTGIEFLALSARKRGQVEEVIRELLEMTGTRRWSRLREIDARVQRTNAITR